MIGKVLDKTFQKFRTFSRRGPKAIISNKMNFRMSVILMLCFFHSAAAHETRPFCAQILDPYKQDYSWFEREESQLTRVLYSYPAGGMRARFFNRNFDEGSTPFRVVRLKNWKLAAFKENTNHTSARAEVAAFRVSQKLELALVPPTALITLGSKLGSIKPYLVGVHERRVWQPGGSVRFESPNTTLRTERFRMLLELFNLLIGNPDTDEFQYIVLPGGQIKQHDNGQAFTMDSRVFEWRLKELNLRWPAAESFQEFQVLRAVSATEWRREFEGLLTEKEIELFLFYVGGVLRFLNSREPQ